MEKDEMLMRDEKKKEEVKKELDFCHARLMREHKALHDYQLDYSCGIDARKDVMNSMGKIVFSDAENSEYVSNIENIMSFCDTRNLFLVEKLKTIDSYISYIKRTIVNYDKINDFNDVNSIDTILRLMLISLGMSLPIEVFGEPF